LRNLVPDIGGCDDEGAITKERRVEWQVKMMQLSVGVCGLVERGICPIATSTINERTIPIIMARCMAHEREGYIFTSGLKSDVTIVFLDPDFL